MSEPSPSRPVPGPPRPAQGPAPTSPESDHPTETGPEAGFADLEERPVSEHVAVFEAEHARLQRELGTIDRL